jgi:uncharacterized DUF497 family protein
MQYNFAWDPEKNKRNRRKHGVGFEQAATVFRDPRAISVFDDEHSVAKEDRWMTLGLSATSGVLVVHHTFEELDSNTIRIRIFSSRKATKQETKQYSEWIMKKEYDFSRGERGKFYRLDAQLNIPVYLESEVQEFVGKIAEAKHSDTSNVVNEILKSDMQLAKVMK